jgi:hypothetical protein
MGFIVPPLQPHLHGLNHFGACKLPQSIADPGGAPASGMVCLRGAVAADPDFSAPPGPPGLLHLFTLPAGMRPLDERWLLCLHTTYVVMHDATPILCLVQPSGEVWVKLTRIGYDGAVFFDGLSFFAERAPGPGRQPLRAAAPRSQRKARRR